VNFQIGDIVSAQNVGEGFLFRIVCFLDRGENLRCDTHRHLEDVEGNRSDLDDVHLQVVWKATERVIPTWPVGKKVVVGAGRLAEPSTESEMLVLALDANADTT